MEIKITTYNADGSISFEGNLNQEQAQFVLQVGINFLLANGSLDFIPDADEDESFEGPSTDTVQ